MTTVILNLHKLIVQTEEYLDANWDILTPEQRDELTDKSGDLLDTVEQMRLAQARLDIIELQNVASQVGAATKRVNQVVDNLDKIEKVLKAVTAAINLATSIITGNPNSIIEALGPIGSAIDDLA